MLLCTISKQTGYVPLHALPVGPSIPCNWAAVFYGYNSMATFTEPALLRLEILLPPQSRKLGDKVRFRNFPGDRPNPAQPNDPRLASEERSPICQFRTAHSGPRSDLLARTHRPASFHRATPFWVPSCGTESE